MIQSHLSDDAAYYTKLKEELQHAKNDHELFDAIVNTPFNDKLKSSLLGLGIIVFLLVNKKTGTVDRVALSKTEQAEGAVRMSAKPFKDIIIPLDAEDNIIVQAIKTGKYTETDDWQYLFLPSLTQEEARFNQAGAGIGYSAVYPLTGKRKGALIFSHFYTPDKIGKPQHIFMQHYSELVSAVL
jgi:hypothetical protein